MLQARDPGRRNHCYSCGFDACVLCKKTTSLIALFCERVNAEVRLPALLHLAVASIVLLPLPFTYSTALAWRVITIARSRRSKIRCGDAESWIRDTYRDPHLANLSWIASPGREEATSLDWEPPPEKRGGAERANAAGLWWSDPLPTSE